MPQPAGEFYLGDPLTQLGALELVLGVGNGFLDFRRALLDGRVRAGPADDAVKVAVGPDAPRASQIGQRRFTEALAGILGDEPRSRQDGDVFEDPNAPVAGAGGP